MTHLQDWVQVRTELDADQNEALDKVHEYAWERYLKYRRQGHDIAHAYQYALAWGRNMSEQVQRRKGHDTGCE